MWKELEQALPLSLIHIFLLVPCPDTESAWLAHGILQTVLDMPLNRRERLSHQSWKMCIRDSTDTDRLGLLSKEYLKMYESRLKAVREAIGPDVDIIIENHSFTDAQSSTQIGLMAKKYDIFYFEEPTTPTPQLSKYVHDNTGLALSLIHI